MNIEQAAYWGAGALQQGWPPPLHVSPLGDPALIREYSDRANQAGEQFDWYHPTLTGAAQILAWPEEAVVVQRCEEDSETFLVGYSQDDKAALVALEDSGVRFALVPTDLLAMALASQLPLPRESVEPPVEVAGFHADRLIEELTNGRSRQHALISARIPQQWVNRHIHHSKAQAVGSVTALRFTPNGIVQSPSMASWTETNGDAVLGRTNEFHRMTWEDASAASVTHAISEALSGW